MTIKLAESPEELEQILALQKENHYEHVPEEKRKMNGFVTVKHDLEVLWKMNENAPQIIATEAGQVVGYALVMLKEIRSMIPVLVPMFEMFDNIQYKGKKLSAYNYYVMGQICIGESYRGKGLFENLYSKHKEIYSGKFEICLTEVSTSNSRSMRAHEKTGFRTIHTFRDATDEWNILLWDWK